MRNGAALGPQSQITASRSNHRRRWRCTKKTHAAPADAKRAEQQITRRAAAAPTKFPVFDPLSFQLYQQIAHQMKPEVIICIPLERVFTFTPISHQ
jgi:hypothetical protein